ncbi:MAG: hypothetical protein V1813_00485 [Candidatus Aenigmatarchaeota archaeon]
MKEGEGNRQTAAMCVARIFEGRGSTMIDDEGRGFGSGPEPRISEREKVLLEDLFDFFLRLMEGEEGDDSEELTRVSPKSRKPMDELWDRKSIQGKDEEDQND